MYSPSHRNIKTVILYILIALFAYSISRAMFKIMEEGTLGSILRHLLPTTPYLLLIVIVSLYNIRRFSFSSLVPAIPSNLTLNVIFKRFFLICLLAVLSGICLHFYGGWLGLVYGSICLYIIVGYVYALVISTKKPLYGFLVLLLLYPFISFIEYDFEKYSIISPLELGPIFLRFSIVAFFIFYVHILFLNSIKNKRRIHTALDLPIYFFAAFLLLSCLVSPNIIVSLRNFYFAVICLVPLYYIVVNNIEDTKDIKSLLVITIMSYSMLIFISYYFVWRGTDDISSKSTLFYGMLQTATFSHGQTGAVAVLTLPLLFAIYLSFSRSKKYVIAFVAMFILLCVIFSYTRSYIVVSILSMPYFMKIKGARKIMFILGLVLVLLAIMKTVFFEKYVFPRFTIWNSFEVFLEDQRPRIDGIQAALKMIRDYPFMGVGPGMWEEYIPLYGKYVYTYRLPNGGYQIGYITFAHNFLLDYGAQAGVLTMGSLIWLFVIIIRKMIYINKKSRGTNDFPIAVGLSVSFSVFVLCGFIGGIYFYHYTGFLGVGILFWIITSSIIAMERVLKKQQVINNLPGKRG